MDTRPPLMMLAHRIPFPPNKGDKLRSYHILTRLQRRFRVHLGCFIDDPADWEHESHVRTLCDSAFFLGVSALRGRLRAVRGLGAGRSVSECHFADPAMKRWIEDTLAVHEPRSVLAVSSPMARYVLDIPGAANLHRVVDFVDMDSEKWRAYGQAARGPLGWVYRREAVLLGHLERRIAEAFDYSLFVSEAEADLFRSQLPGVAHRIKAIENGVDAEFFAPDPGLENPYDAGTRALVFTGAMDYTPNIEAVSWFAEQVYPRLRDARADLRFYVVGLNPTEDVRALERVPGVHVTGRVPDVRPYLQHAALAVAPMRVARGVQNKVLEALSMDKRVVATAHAAEGIHPGAQLGIAEAETEDDYLSTILRELESSDEPNVARPEPGGIRDAVVAHYDWDRNLERLGELLLPTTMAESDAA